MNKNNTYILVAASVVVGFLLLCIFILRHRHMDDAEGYELYENTSEVCEGNHLASDDVSYVSDNYSIDTIELLELPRHFSSDEQVISHYAYTVGYNLAWHIPNWVAYELTSEEVYGEESRTNKFLPDPLVKGDPVITQDYSGSGYDRGHMAPAGDMKWSATAMKESFYMTNMCPQNHNNNAGDWKDLEEFARDLASKYGSIYICCGPIVFENWVTIGNERQIVVPNSFYKVFLRKKGNDWTSIGFVMPNAPGNKPLMSYMCSVDDVEQMTGIDMFYQLPDSIEDIIESDFEISDWTL